MRTLRTGILAFAVASQFSLAALADSVTLSGPTDNASMYSTSQLATFAGSNTTSSGGLTGVSLWNLLGGADAANTSATWGKITTSTPAGDNAKNSILRYYVLATGSNGERSVVSLGEIAPRFGGTPSNPSGQAFIAFQTATGTLLSDPQLVIPNGTGRNISDLQSLQLLSVPALPNLPASTSQNVALNGAVAAPGVYSLNDLQGFPATNVTIGPPGSTNYTGVKIWDFLKPLSSDPDQLVVFKGTDGYEVVHALAEFDPSLGGNLLNLIAYMSTGTDFPNGGIARTILPFDTDKKGRFMSNLYEVSLIDAPLATPLPAALPLFATILAGGGLIAWRRKRKAEKVVA